MRHKEGIWARFLSGAQFPWAQSFIISSPIWIPIIIQYLGPVHEFIHPSILHALMYSSVHSTDTYWDPPICHAGKVQGPQCWAKPFWTKTYKQLKTDFTLSKEINALLQLAIGEGREKNRVLWQEATGREGNRRLKERWRIRKSHQGRDGGWSKVSMWCPSLEQGRVCSWKHWEELRVGGTVLFFPPALPLMSYCNPSMSFLKVVSREQGSILGEDRSIKM